MTQVNVISMIKDRARLMPSSRVRHMDRLMARLRPSSNSSNSNNQLNGSNTIQRDSTTTRRPVNPSHFGRSYRVSTSPEDRLSLPLSMAFKGQDNSIPAFNNYHHAGSQLTVNSGELTSSNSRSEILTVVSDGQADGIINSHAVGGAVTSHPQLPTQVEIASADKYSNDSMGVLS
jgi:hypothetical protein